jgi:dolichol kinase
VSELRRELVRKLFHMLSLVYWGVYALSGWPRAGWIMTGWLALVLVVETARLKVPAVERFLVGMFEGMIRDTERAHYSGIAHTTAGCLAAMLIARGDARIVGAAIGQLAFGDSAAALFGKAFGRTKILGGSKSLEGSLAALSVCYTIALLCGVGARAALASAAVAALVELLPTTGFFNDNLWLPASSALTLRLLLGK